MTSRRRIYYLAVLVVLGALLGPADVLAADLAVDWGAPHVLSAAPSGSPVATTGRGFVTVDASSLEEAADDVTTTIHYSADGWTWAQVREL